MNDHNRIINCTMVYREAIGYTNVHSKGCGESFLAFSKDTVRRKAWTIFCKRRTFVPMKNHHLCSDHFTRDKNQRDPAQLEQYGYDMVRIGLKPDAVPDVPLHIIFIYNWKLIQQRKRGCSFATQAPRSLQ